MIIAIDTNIFIGACIGQGACLDVIASCLQKDNQALMGSALFAEYEDVLARDALFKGSRLNASERDELLDIFIATTTWTKVYYNWRPNLKDEADNHLIELAIAGNAKTIVTRNLRDFASMELKFPELQILSPEDFLNQQNRQGE